MSKEKRISADRTKREIGHADYEYTLVMWRDGADDEWIPVSRAEFIALKSELATIRSAKP
jgi:hypothetical protein